MREQAGRGGETPDGHHVAARVRHHPASRARRPPGPHDASPTGELAGQNPPRSKAGSQPLRREKTPSIMSSPATTMIAPATTLTVA